jgi:(p)ppGpp synthase/HD superfamily hydrolase
VSGAGATRLTPRFHYALSYASMLHQDQLRKKTPVPYVAHLLGACATVLINGGTEDEAIAALLHDAAEDQGGEEQLKRIQSVFGADVARIVRACSDSLVDTRDGTVEKEPWHVRKSRYVEELESEGDQSILIVSAADKLDNLRAIERDYRSARSDPEGEQALWRRFNGGKDGTLWYYQRLAGIYAANGGRVAGIAAEMTDLLDRLPTRDPSYEPRASLAR